MELRCVYSGWFIRFASLLMTGKAIAWSYASR